MATSFEGSQRRLGTLEPKTPGTSGLPRRFGDAMSSRCMMRSGPRGVGTAGGSAEAIEHLSVSDCSATGCMKDPPPAKRIKLESPSPGPPNSTGGSPREEEEDIDDQCSICLQRQTDRTLIPRCSHEFCFECLVIWTGEPASGTSVVSISKK